MVRKPFVLLSAILVLVSVLAGCRPGAQARTTQAEPPPGPPVRAIAQSNTAPVRPVDAEDEEPDPPIWEPFDEAAIPAVPPADMAGLEALVKEYLSKQKGVYGVFAYELGTGESLAVNADIPFRAASTFKLPMAMYILDLVEEGKADLREMLAFQEEDFEEGAGSLQVWIKPEDALSVRMLIDLAITESDNIATNMLLRRFGWWNVHTFMRQHGATVTLDEQGRNAVTPRDMARFMLLAAGDEIIQSEELRSYLFYLLTHTVFWDRIPAGVSDEVPVAHKVGTLDGVVNDVGLVLLPGRPYVLSVFSDGVEAWAGARTIGTISRMLYEYEKARVAGLPEEGIDGVPVLIPAVNPFADVGDVPVLKPGERPEEGPNQGRNEGSDEDSDEGSDEGSDTGPNEGQNGPGKGQNDSGKGQDDPGKGQNEDPDKDQNKDPKEDLEKGQSDDKGPAGQQTHAPAEPPREGTSPKPEDPSGSAGLPEEDADQDQEQHEQADAGVDPVTEPEVDEEGGDHPEEGRADQNDQPDGDQAGADGDGEVEEQDGQTGGQEQAGEAGTEPQEADDGNLDLLDMAGGLLETLLNM